MKPGSAWTGNWLPSSSTSFHDLWIALLHTEVQEGFEGQGIGSQLVARTLEDIRARGLKVIPKCPFVVRWLERHPEQQDILSHPLHGGAAPTPVEPVEPA